MPRRADNNPKTIDQIHAEIAAEDQQRAINIQNLPSLPPKNQGGGKRGGRGPPGYGGGMGGGEDGWTAVGRSSKNNAIDPARMKISRQSVDENIQLGPQLGRPSFGSWARGSSGGSGGRSASQELSDQRPPTPSNRYKLLHISFHPIFLVTL